MFFRGVSSVLLLDRSGNDMLCSMLFLSLGLDVLTDHFYWCPSCRQKTETLAPECFFPKFFPDFRILFFQQSAAGTFISIDKFTEFRFRLCTKHYVHIVNIMILFLQNNSIPWSNIFPYLFCPFWNWIIDNFSSIFYHHDQMIIHQVHWMCIMIYIFHKTSPFLNNHLIDWFYYTMNRILEQVFFCFLQFISHL